MIERIAGAPAGIVALRAVGQVSTADYEATFKPALEAAIAEHGKVRLVYELGAAFTGYSAGAAWEDLKLGVGYLTAFERCAVVTDHTAMADSVRALGLLMPGAVKVFPTTELEVALAWAAA
jgi:SpoIIAA-like